MNTTPSEDEIQAYVDGRLDETRRQAVEFYLTQRPERAEEVRAWQRDAQQLRAELSGEPDLVPNPALDPARIRARRRDNVRRRWAAAAMVLLSVGIGCFSGWQARGWRDTSLQPPMADAIQAYRMFARKSVGRFDFVSEHYDDLHAWMDAHFLGAPNPPDLTSVGFHAVGVRLIATADGPAAMVLYLNTSGEAIIFYVRPPSVRGTLPLGGRRDGDLVTEYGSAHGYEYAFVSRSDAHMLQLLHRAMRSLTT
jgi:anti-sigma factor RsiW